MNKREVALGEYLPQFVKDFDEIKTIVDIENIELNELRSNIARLNENQFFLFCDEDGIERFEELLDITPNVDETLENRRLSVYSSWNADVPYTLRYLVSVLNKLCGEDGYILELKNQEYLLRVGLTVREKGKFDLVLDKLKKIVPCNLTIDEYIDYNKYGLFARFTHGEMEQFMHIDLRASVIEQM